MAAVVEVEAARLALTGAAEAAEAVALSSSVGSAHPTLRQR